MRRRPNKATTSPKPLPGVLISDLLEALRRYSNARRRARFWSGNPSLSNFGPTGKNLSTSKMDEKYELAMCDCDSWEQTIERLTGKRPEHYDPQRAFAARFSKLLSKASNCV